MVRAVPKPFVVGIAFGAIYLLVEATVDSLIFDRGHFARSLFVPGFHEAWMRLLVIGFIFAMSWYAHRRHRSLAYLIAERTRETVELRAEAQRVAVSKERERLAHELHDSSTQTLFAINLIADALPLLWDQKPDEARRQLEELQQLTRGVLAEMRALLLELRPDALTDAEPAELLQHLVDSFAGRTRLPIELTIDCPCTPRPKVKAALYRIAQQALFNVSRHAKAERVSVSLHCRQQRLVLAIRDDGRGFDPDEIPAESFGLRIMRERAEVSGATLALTSRPGAGTTVRAVWEETAILP
jgi:signal transduction histidine kinase